MGVRNLGPERYHDLERLRRRYARSLKPRGTMTIAGYGDYYASVLKGLRGHEPNSLSTAETELLECLKRQANPDALQVNIQEVDRQIRDLQNVAAWVGAVFGVEAVRFGAQAAPFGVKGANVGVENDSRKVRRQICKRQNIAGVMFLDSSSKAKAYGVKCANFLTSGEWFAANVACQRVGE